MKVRVCPKCGKHNLENAWHCADCGVTLSVKTLIDTEDAQSAAKSALSNISQYFHEDVAELLNTVIQGSESVVFGSNITQLARIPPFRFGYLIITSQRLICVQFNSEVTRDVPSSAFSVLLQPVGFLIKELVGVNVRPKRPSLGGAVLYPGYPLTPREKASRSVVIHDLEDLVSADLASRWYGETHLISLTAKFRQGKDMMVTFYTPHRAQEACKLLTACLAKSYPLSQGR